MEDIIQSSKTRVFLANRRPDSKRSNGSQFTTAFVLHALAILAFAVLAVFAHFNSHFDGDMPLQHFVRNIDLPYFADLMQIVSTPANDRMPHIIAVVTALVFLLFRFRREASCLLIATMGSGVLNVLIKLAVARPRPIDAPGMIFMSYDATSFPSGHVTFFVCYFGFLAFAVYTRFPVSSSVRNMALVLMAAPIFLIPPPDPREESSRVLGTGSLASRLLRK